MINAVQIDLNHHLKRLVMALQPFAEAKEVEIRFSSTLPAHVVVFISDGAFPKLASFLSKLIAFTPADHAIMLTVEPKGTVIQLRIGTSGFYLWNDFQVVLDINSLVSFIPFRITGREVYFFFPLEEHAYNPPFYQRFHQALRSYFQKNGTVKQLANIYRRQDGFFLKKVNTIIIEHVGQEGFDSSALGKALCLSRSKLHRHLKSLVDMPPAKYIRFIRLQRSRELIEKEGANVSEAAFQVGFVSLSHFTRIFRDQFGVNPSKLRQNQGAN